MLHVKKQQIRPARLGVFFRRVYGTYLEATSAAITPAQVQGDCEKAQDAAAQRRLFFLRCKTGPLDNAIDMFVRISRTHILVWNAFIQAHSCRGSHQKILVIFDQMLQEGIMPNKVTFSCVLSSCAVLSRLSDGMRVHACLHCSKLSSNLIVITALIDMHGKCGSMEGALQLFDSLIERDVVVFNAIMTSLLKHELESKVFQLFDQMQHEGVMPSRVTYVTVVEACATLGDGELVYCRISSCREHQADVSLGNAFIHMYGRCNHPAKAQQHFFQMQTWDAISWNTLMGVFYSQENIRKVFDLFVLMQKEGFSADECTYVTILSSCANVKALTVGMHIHMSAVFSCMELNVGLSTALLSMYGRCGCFEDALRVFHRMEAKNVVTWNAMLALCSQHENYEDAVHLFHEMIEAGMHPDKVTFIHVISACTDAGSVANSQSFCLLAFKFGYDTDPAVVSSLVNMYGKCGELEEANTTFFQSSNPNVLLWNVVLKVYACHGDGEGIFGLLNQMQETGVVPDDVTFLAVLSGCDHLGHICNGILSFKYMREIYGIVPGVSHFVCLIDLLGRAGRLEEAACVTDVIPLLIDEVCITALASAYHYYRAREQSIGLSC